MTYRFFLTGVFLFLISCSDGYFEAPPFDFEPDVYVCGNYLLYRANQDKTEALILSLSPDAVPAETGEILVPVSAENMVYRIFDAPFTSDYFCAPIPPEKPLVKEQWVPVSGANNRISITTTEVTDTGSGAVTGYKHDIVLHNLVLVKDNDKMIYETFVFGSFQTSLRELPDH